MEPPSLPPPPPLPEEPLDAPPRGRPNRAVAVILAVALLGGSGAGIWLATRTRDDVGLNIDLTPHPLPSGWNETVFRSDGFAIAFPPAWRAIDPRNAEDGLDAISNENPELASLVRTQIGSLSDLIRLLAVDSESPSLSQDFATNANVIVQPVPSGVTFEEFVQANAQQLRTIPGVTTSLEDDAVSMPAGRAALVRSRLPIKTANGETIAAVSQYLLLSRGRGYILSFTTTPELEASYVSVFDAITRTFRYV